MPDDFDAFLKEREQAAQAYVTGDGAPVDRLATREGDSSFFSPGGDVVTGAQAVVERYLSDAQLFKPNGTSRFEVIQKGSDGDLAFWTGYQVARAQIGGMPEAIDMKLRITEIFRRFDGSWKLIHRHADMGQTAE